MTTTPTTIINAKLSSCCSTSVSVNYGISEFGNRLLYITSLKKHFHYTCNKCGKECEMNEVPRWELILVKTKSGFKNKYRNI